MSRDKTPSLDALVPHRLSKDDYRKAQLAVASNSASVDDCALLLDILGLNFPIDGLTMT
jgi:hypothetical protein